MREAPCASCLCADTDDGLTCKKPRDEFRSLGILIVLVVARHRRMDVIVREQRARMPRVLGRDAVRCTQRLNGAVGDVAEVADGRSAEIKPSRLFHSGSSVFYTFSFCFILEGACCQEKRMKITRVKSRLYFSFLPFHFLCIHI